jgi:hypothetical protein
VKVRVGVVDDVPMVAEGKRVVVVISVLVSWLRAARMRSKTVARNIIIAAVRRKSRVAWVHH